MAVYVEWHNLFFSFFFFSQSYYLQLCFFLVIETFS